MDFLTDLKTLNEMRGAGVAAAVGVFDGVHRGHRALIDRVVEQARKRDLRALVVTFRQHPLALLAPPYAPPSLSDAEEKRALIAKCGADVCLMLDFTPELAAMDAERFVREILVDGARARVWVCGRDFRFGAGGTGDTHLLERLGARHGFELDLLDTLHDGDAPIKSTRIRQCLLDGDLDDATRLLGRAYTLSGRVVHGERRGRQLGRPTANVAPPPERLVPGHAVYAVRVEVEGRRHDAVMNIGVRPTFEGERPTLEAHLLDFSGDLYGRDVRIEFVARLREERRFESGEALARQIALDDIAARAVLDKALTKIERQGQRSI